VFGADSSRSSTTNLYFGHSSKANGC
jgi:hypothetical protein